MKKDITILLTYSQEHQINYINFLLKSIKHTISNHGRVKYLLGVDTGKQKNPPIDKINFHYDKLLKVDTKNLDYSSYAHSVVMDEMIKHIDTKYAVICDSDIAFLKKDWDIDFINMLNDKHILVGGESNHVTYFFPHIYMAFFDAEKFKELKVTLAPIKNNKEFIKKYNIKINEEDKNYDVEIPDELVKYYKVKKFYADTSSQLPYILKKNGYKGISLKCVWSNGKRKRHLEEHQNIFLNEDDQGQEFIINNTVYFTHQGRCSREWGIDEKNIRWVKQVKKYYKDILKINL